jgi:hypothetical protein
LWAQGSGLPLTTVFFHPFESSNLKVMSIKTWLRESTINDLNFNLFYIIKTHFLLV